MFTSEADRAGFTGSAPGLSMAEGLPEGLVSNTEAITGDIRSVDRIVVEDLAYLWRGNVRCDMLVPRDSSLPED